MRDDDNHPCPPDMMQRGTSMIEVLAALLVLSIAFLGVAALQTLALTSANNAAARSMAILTAHSIMDGLRIDPAGHGGYGTIDSAHCGADGGSLTQHQRHHFCHQLISNLGVGSRAQVACANDQCTVRMILPDIPDAVNAVDEDTTGTVLIMQGVVP